MQSKEYLDFDLLIARAEQGFVAHVLISPAGQAKKNFILPFNPLELENFILRLGQSRRGARRVDSPEIQTAKEIGGRLFNTIFDDTMQACLLNSIDVATGKNKGLRIRLRLDDPELAGLPWEYLYFEALDRWYALSTDTPIVRYIELPEKIRPLNVKPPLHVLAMIASPSDYEPLDVEKEWDNLRAAMQALIDEGKVILDRLEDPSLSGLRKQLGKAEYHIFHFIGHGAFDQSEDDGILIFETENEAGTSVSGQALGVVLQGHKSLRLAVINACEGARASPTDQFSGVAQSLIRQGIPAVIAMQFEISDKAAITFAHEFYSSLLSSDPVDEALTNARLAIFTDVKNVEWGTPVLFMRSPNGKIFNISQEEKQKPPRKPAESTDTGLSLIFPNLVFTTGLNAGQAIQLKAAAYIIGREEAPADMGLAIVVPDVQVSRKHAKIWFEGEHFMIKDLGSKNGTRVNGIQLLEARALSYGDEIKVGDSLLVFQKEAQSKTGLKGTIPQAGGAEPGTPAFKENPPGRVEMPPMPVKTPAPPQREPRAPENSFAQIARLYTQADSARQKKDWVTASEALKAILDLDPNQSKALSDLDFVQRKTTSSEQYRQAQEAKSRGDWPGAILALETMLRTETEPGVVSALRAELEKARQTQTIERLAEEAREARMQGENTQALLKVRAVLDLDRTNLAAQAELNELQKLVDQEKVDALTAEARAASAQDNIGQAIQKYQAILHIQSDNPQIRYELAEAQKKQRIASLSSELQAALSQGNWKTAFEKSEALLNTDPTLEEIRQVRDYARENWQNQNIESLYSQGKAHFQAGRSRFALDCFYKVREMAGDFRDIGPMIASLETALGKPRTTAASQASAQAAKTPKESDWTMYESPGIDIYSLAGTIEAYFKTNGFETQVVQQGAVTMVQGKKSGFRSMLGMSLATSVLLEATDQGLKVSMGGGKWAEQGAAIAMGLLLSVYLIPFAVTGGIGMYQQKKLIDELWKLVDQHVFSQGGRRVPQA